jgi:hypothetical protein
MEIYFVFFFPPAKKKKEPPTHKTAHLQTAPADTKPKFAKELFSCLTHPCKFVTFELLKIENRKYYDR